MWYIKCSTSTSLEHWTLIKRASGKTSLNSIRFSAEKITLDLPVIEFVKYKSKPKRLRVPLTIPHKNYTTLEAH